MKCKECGEEKKEYRASLCFDCWCDKVGDMIEKSPIGSVEFITAMREAGASVPEMEHSVIVTGFISEAEAQEFIKWFEGSGEQATDYWFEGLENDEIRDGIYTNIKKTYPLHKLKGAFVLDVSPRGD